MKKYYYYFDHSAWVFRKEIIVVTEAAFRKIQDECKPGWNNDWLYTQDESLKAAKEHFTKEWCNE